MTKYRHINVRVLKWYLDLRDDRNLVEFFQAKPEREELEDEDRTRQLVASPIYGNRNWTSRPRDVILLS